MATTLSLPLCPNSPQECFDLTIKAFNLAEKYRVPVMFMLDEVVGHMTEKVIIPPADQINIEPRRLTHKPPSEFKLYATDASLVPEMVHAGEGYRFHVTGLTHDERGYPNMTPKVQQELVQRLRDKIYLHADEIVEFESESCEDADVVVLSYGITSRVAQRAIDLARTKGLKVGKFRLITAWPFPEKAIRKLAAQGEGVCGARTEPRADGAGSGALRRREMQHYLRSARRRQCP